MKRSLAMPALVAGIALIAVIVFWRGGVREDEQRGSVKRVAVSADVDDAVRKSDSFLTDERASDSLRGTEVDGEIALDAEGHPIADRGMRRLFDYFLARIGEQSLRAIRAALSAHLSMRFPAPVVVAVLEHYDAYVALTQDMAMLSPTGDDLKDAARLHDLRRARLGETVAEAWYGEEERYLQATLARRAILADAALDDAHKASALAALDAALDPAQRVGRQQTDMMNDAVAQTERFDASSISAAERFAEREKTVGPEAAARLATLDGEHAAWNSRLAQFSTQRERVMANTSLSPQAREIAVQSLLVSRFDARERLRVDALMRAGVLPATSSPGSTSPGTRPARKAGG